MSIEPNKKTIKSALKRSFVFVEMKQALLEGRYIKPEWYLGEVWSALYRSLYPEDWNVIPYYPCTLSDYLKRMCEDGIITRGDILFEPAEGDEYGIAEIRLKSGIWRIQIDRDYMEVDRYVPTIIAYHKEYGSSVHGCIHFGPHFIEFLHQIDAWQEMLEAELRRCCLAASRSLTIEKIGRETFESLVKNTLARLGYEYTAEYHNENCVTLKIHLPSGYRVNLPLTLKELQEKSDSLRDDLRAIDRVVSGYGGKISISHDRK